MRRFFFVVLMFVLMLQTTWSAAADVCRHETASPAPAHFGHHVHQDASSDAQQPIPSEGGAQLPHLDCVGCHGGLCAVLPDWPAALSAVLPAGGHATPYRRSITDGLPERLIRPPHRFLA
ncbi:MAG TPA: hypothetical protein VMS38_31260 [Pseudorhodoferax sp.]|nr:hypothetical protein [Pseudorhodoferax sp.]